MITLFKKSISRFLIAIILMGQIPITHASMVTTDSVIKTQQQEWNRNNIATLLQQENVRVQLASMGIDPDTAKKRVANMTDQEVATLNQTLAAQPAGSGVGVLGVVLVVFIVLVVTDMLGATDVFSFVHDINHRN